jgi:hypothetical protein
MIEIDRSSVGALLQERGIVFRELSVKGNVLRLTFPDSDSIPLEDMLYVGALVEALGLKGAWVTHRHNSMFLERN